MCFIDGAAQLGKARLLRETVRMAEAVGFRIISGSAGDPNPSCIERVLSAHDSADRGAPLLVAVDDVLRHSRQPPGMAKQQDEVELGEAIDQLPDLELELTGEGFDISEERYAELVRRVITDEIGRGEGVSFVLRCSSCTT